MQTITKRLTDTATILANLPELLDLADERELGMLAALVKGYVECGGPEDWQNRPGYLEGVALAALVKEGDDDQICSNDVAESENSVADSAIDYLRHLKATGSEDDETGWWLLRSAFDFARRGQPEEVDLGKPFYQQGSKVKPCSMRRAFELAIAFADAEAKRKEDAERTVAEAATNEAELEASKGHGSKPPAKMTPAERKQALAEMERRQGSYGEIARTLRHSQREDARRIRTLRRLVKQDGARKAVPIDSKRRQRKAA